MRQAGREAGAALAARLRERRAEIEQATLTRVNAVAPPGAVDDPIYASGLRLAVSTAIEYALEAVERGAEQLPPPPAALRSQAGLAARSGVGLEVVLRRYSVGYSLLADFIVEEAERAGVGGKDLQRLLRDHAATFDVLVATVSEEHAREERQRSTTAPRRRVERVQQLLDGDLVDSAELVYDLAGHHLAIVGSGLGIAAAIESLGERLDRRLLIVSPEEHSAWAWFGGRRPFPAEELALLTSFRWPVASSVACGAPGMGLTGWRLSHRQACAALPIARGGSEPLVRYADAALLAAVLHDELLASSLRQLYLEPLERDRDGGETARGTLRAYFASGRSVTSAAAALAVHRRTVANRLRAIEDRLDQPLEHCALAVELALALEEMGHPARSGSSPHLDVYG